MKWIEKSYWLSAIINISMIMRSVSKMNYNRRLLNKPLCSTLVCIGAYSVIRQLLKGLPISLINKLYLFFFHCTS